jgi:hypothetical protein
MIRAPDLVCRTSDSRARQRPPKCRPPSPRRGRSPADQAPTEAGQATDHRTDPGMLVVR